MLNIYLLNHEQRLAFDAIIRATDSDGPHGTSGAVFFLEGLGGTGKTFTYTCLLSHIRSQGKVALAVASSGIAALLLEGGRTGHSRFKIPINILDTSTCYINKEGEAADLVRACALLIWDEAPMMQKHVYEALNRTLIDITGNNSPFGGIVTVLGGDFRQMLPVVPKGSK